MAEREILATARKVASLLNKQRKLKAELKKVQAELRHERKMLRHLTSSLRSPAVVPSRIFGDAVGYVVPPAEKPELSEASKEFLDAAEKFVDEL